MGDLASGAHVIRHRRLRGAAVDDEGAAQRGDGVGSGKAQDVRVRIHGFLVAQAESPRGRGALGNDHHDARGRDGKQRENIARGHVRQAEHRESVRHGADDRDALVGEVELPTRGDRPDDRNQRERHPGRKTVSKQDAACHERRQRQGGDVGLAQTMHDLPCAYERVARIHRDPGHVAEHGGGDLHSDAGEEPDQDRA